jgi:hypothetical protein
MAAAAAAAAPAASDVYDDDISADVYGDCDQTTSTDDSKRAPDDHYLSIGQSLCRLSLFVACVLIVDDVVRAVGACCVRQRVMGPFRSSGSNLVRSEHFCFWCMCSFIPITRNRTLYGLRCSQSRSISPSA